MSRPDPYDFGASRYDSPAFGPSTVHTRWWHELADGRVQCDVCPQACRLHEGQRGMCFVRGREADEIVMTTYGRTRGYCVEPIEKESLYHWLPGTRVLSYGTAGCNLTCAFCPTWQLVNARETDALTELAAPEDIAREAQQRGCESVAFTNNDPIVFYEYALDTARECRKRDIRTVAVTAGYVEPGPRADFFDKIDAVSVDLKGFSAEYYRTVCGGELAKVLDTLTWLVRNSAAWVEVTTLLVPGRNDSDTELHELTSWLFNELGPDVPLHFAAVSPEGSSTSPTTVLRARDMALAAGLRFVYIDPDSDPGGATTYCSSCQNAIIVRAGHRIENYALTDTGQCTHCGNQLPGRYDGLPIASRPDDSQVFANVGEKIVSKAPR